MLELYEQNRVPPSQASEAEGSAGGSQRPPSKGLADEEHITSYSSSHGGATSKAASLKPPSRPGPDQQHTDNHSGPPMNTQTRNNDYGSSETNSVPDRLGDDEINDAQDRDQDAVPHRGTEGHGEDDQEGNSIITEPRDAVEVKDKYHGRNLSSKDVAVSSSPQDATKKLDTEKLKAAFERRKARGAISRKVDPVDELERELEDVEMPSESEKTKPERKQSWSKAPNRGAEHENSHHAKYSNEAEDGHYQATKGQSSYGDDFDTVEEGEVEPSDEADRGYRSPKSSNRKRKPGSPLDRNGMGRLGYSERDHKRQLQENHV